MRNIYLVTERFESDNLDSAYLVGSMWEALRALLRDHGTDNVDFYWQREDMVLLMRNGEAFARIEEVQLEV